MQKRAKNKKRSGGFTLIELLAVLIIIGILAAIGLPRYFMVVERNRLAEAPSLLQAYKDAVVRSCLKNGNDFNKAKVAGDLDIDIDPAHFKSFNAPGDATGASCGDFDIATTKKAGSCWSACYTSGDCAAPGVTASIDEAGSITWTGIAKKGCEP